MGVRLRQEGWRQDRRRFTVSQTITGDPPFADTGLLNEHNPGLLVRPRPFADIPSDKRFPDERGKGDPRATTAIAVSRNPPHRRSPIAPPPLAQAGRRRIYRERRGDHNFASGSWGKEYCPRLWWVL